MSPMVLDRTSQCLPHLPKKNDVCRGNVILAVEIPIRGQLYWLHIPLNHPLFKSN